MGGSGRYCARNCPAGSSEQDTCFSARLTSFFSAAFGPRLSEDTRTPPVSIASKSLYSLLEDMAVVRRPLGEGGGRFLVGFPCCEGVMVAIVDVLSTAASVW